MHRVEKGFTLIETIVFIAVFTLVMSAISSLTIAYYRTNSYAFEQASALASARRGIEFAVRDIREAAYSDEGSYPVISMATSSFYFYSDFDRDDSIERVRYFIENDIFKKGVTNAAGIPLAYDDDNEIISIVSDYVRNTEEGADVFFYYDEVGDQITEFDDVTTVRFVAVNLIVNINPVRAPEEFTLRSSAAIRNLKNETSE